MPKGVARCAAPLGAGLGLPCKSTSLHMNTGVSISTWCLILLCLCWAIRFRNFEKTGMKTISKKHSCLLIAVAVAALLSACGKKEDAPSVSVAASGQSTGDQPANPNLKKTDQFGLQSSIILEPVFEVPSKYASYVRQEVTEAAKDEFQKLPNTMFDAYVATWLKQAASVDAPDWSMLAGILHPDSVGESNAFKIQEAAEEAKTEVTADKGSLNMAYGWQGEVVRIAGPDVKTGEYYLTVSPQGRFNTISYTHGAKPYHYGLGYMPVFNEVGMEIDCAGSRSCNGDVTMTVKVPLDRAKAIEALREKGKDMVRLYGHVTGKKEFSDRLSKDSASASLNLQVEAIEIGSRQNGQFKSYFFLDNDQLKRWKS